MFIDVSKTVLHTVFYTLVNLKFVRIKQKDQQCGLQGQLIYLAFELYHLYATVIYMGLAKRECLTLFLSVSFLSYYIIQELIFNH